MCDPGDAVVCEGKKIGSGNSAGLEQVLAGFQMKPKIAITNRAGGEENREGKHVDFKDLLKR